MTDQVIEFYRERARGKTGLIIAGAAGVDPVGMNTVGMMQICDDSYIYSLKRLTELSMKQDPGFFSSSCMPGPMQGGVSIREGRQRLPHGMCAALQKRRHMN